MMLTHVDCLHIDKTSNDCLEFKDGDKCLLHLDAPVVFNYRVYDAIKAAVNTKFSKTNFHRTVVHNDMFCEVDSSVNSSTLEIVIYKSDYISRDIILWIEANSYPTMIDHWWWEDRMTLDEYLTPAEAKEVPVATNFELVCDEDKSVLNFNYICNGCKQSYALTTPDLDTMGEVRDVFTKCLKKAYEKQDWQCEDVTYTLPDHTEFYVEFEVQYVNSESDLDMDVWVSRKTYDSESDDLLIKVTSIETNGKTFENAFKG